MRIRYRRVGHLQGGFIGRAVDAEGERQVDQPTVAITALQSCKHFADDVVGPQLVNLEGIYSVGPTRAGTTKGQGAK